MRRTTDSMIEQAEERCGAGSATEAWRRCPALVAVPAAPMPPEWRFRRAAANARAGAPCRERCITCQEIFERGHR